VELSQEALLGKLVGRTVVDPKSGCWIWQGAHNGKKGNRGYGVIRVDCIKQYTHRLMASIVFGPIPEGVEVRHGCDNPPCCNPAHLSLGTHLDNGVDMVTRGRHVYGQRQHGAKLNDAKVREIRKRYAQGGILQRELGEEYGITQSHISFITKGKAWRHVEQASHA
jgi:hypothetical protein